MLRITIGVVKIGENQNKRETVYKDIEMNKINQEKSTIEDDSLS